MNRHERRRQAAERRRVKAEGQKTKRPAREQLPPAYFKLVERLVQLIRHWIVMQPTPPRLNWLERGDTIFVGSLGDPNVQKFLADSPDAFRLLAWLDEQTGREATLFQADCALRLAGMFRELEHSDVPGSACGHCGVRADKATYVTARREKPATPTPGAYSICIACANINRFDEAMNLVRVTEQDLDGLPADHREYLTRHRDTVRMAYLGAWGGRGKVEA